MKITKFPQSCLLIEHNGKRLVIDPGSLVAERYRAQSLLPIDGILITHEHDDHAQPEFIRNLLEPRQIPVVANQSTAGVLGKLVTQVVTDGETFTLAGIQITARELPHCLLTDGSAGPQNTGFVVDGTFFHPGDGISLEGLTVASAAVPIAGPDISPKDAIDFIRQLGCKTVIPMHYDAFLQSPQVIKRSVAKVLPAVNVVVLESGQATEL